MSIDAAAVADRGRALRARTFSSLHVPNYRRYTYGQLTSLIGTWMQSTAQALLVLQLTGSGTDLGIVVGLQTLPILLFGPYAGVIVDRFDKRRSMTITQTIMGSTSALVGILTLSGDIRIQLLFVTAFVFGLANSVANPARQSFVMEMVGPDQLRNAVTLNTVLVNVARAVGPAVAAVLIEVVGIGWCFVADAISYAVVITTLILLDGAQLHPAPPLVRARGQLREGLIYVRRTPTLFVPLLMMGLVGTLTYEFQVSLPLVARYSFHGSAATYGTMTAAMGVGAVIGGLAAAGRQRRGPTLLARSSLIFGVVVLLAAAAPLLWLEVLALAFVGGASVTFLSLGNTTLQLQADPAMRGRVMALWSVAFLGTTPFGGPVVGAIGEHIGPRIALLVGGVAALAAGGIGYVVLKAAAVDGPVSGGAGGGGAVLDGAVLDGAVMGGAVLGGAVMDRAAVDARAGRGLTEREEALTVSAS